MAQPTTKDDHAEEELRAVTSTQHDARAYSPFHRSTVVVQTKKKMKGLLARLAALKPLLDQRQVKLRRRRICVGCVIQ